MKLICRPLIPLHAALSDTTSNVEYLFPAHTASSPQKTSLPVIPRSASNTGQRRTMGYFIPRKFDLPEVKAELWKYGFVDGNYFKIIATWG